MIFSYGQKSRGKSNIILELNKKLEKEHNINESKRLIYLVMDLQLPIEIIKIIDKYTIEMYKSLFIF